MGGRCMKSNLTGSRVRLHPDIIIEIEKAKPRTTTQKKLDAKMQAILENLQESNILLPKCKNLQAKKFVEILSFDFKNMLEKWIVLEILENYNKLFKYDKKWIISFVSTHYPEDDEELKPEKIVYVMEEMLKQMNNKITIENLKMKRFAEIIELFAYCRSNPITKP